MTDREAKLAAALATLDEGELEDFHERAGIMEHCGGRPKEEAEREAWQIVKGNR